MRPNSHRFSTRHQLMQHNVHQRPEMYNSFKISPKPCPTNATHLFTHRSSSTNTWLGWNVHFNSSSRPRTRYLGESCRERNVRGENSLVCSSSGKFIHFHSFLLFSHLSHYLTHHLLLLLLRASATLSLMRLRVERENWGKLWKHVELQPPFAAVKSQNEKDAKLPAGCLCLGQVVSLGVFGFNLLWWPTACEIMSTGQMNGRWEVRTWSGVEWAWKLSFAEWDW